MIRPVSWRIAGSCGPVQQVAEEHHPALAHIHWIHSKYCMPTLTPDQPYYLQFTCKSIPRMPCCPASQLNSVLVSPKPEWSQGPANKTTCQTRQATTWSSCRHPAGAAIKSNGPSPSWPRLSGCIFTTTTTTHTIERTAITMTL